MFNWYLDLQRHKIEEEISAKNNEISEINRPIEIKYSKQRSFCNKIGNVNEADRPPDPKFCQEFWHIFEVLEKVDSIKISYDGIWSQRTKQQFSSIGLENADDIISFIKTNSITNQDEAQIEKVEKLKNEESALWYKSVDIYDRMLFQNEQLQYSIRALICLLIITFPCRFLFKAIRWSIRILRQ